jgi:hypothetical protein
MAIQTYVLDAATGAGAYVGASLPEIASAGGDGTLVGFTHDKGERVLIYRERQRP